MVTSKETWDCFISYSSDDRDSVASLLAHELRLKGIRVWYDQFEITPGTQLLRTIDEGLANSKFGIVILSHHFFSKEWTQRELAGLYSLSIQEGDKSFIIPVWHKISAEEIRMYSPLLSDIVSISWDLGLENVVAKILALVHSKRYKNPDEEYVSVLSETYKALKSPDFLKTVPTIREKYSSSYVQKALESILLNPDMGLEIRIHALETLCRTETIIPEVMNQILSSKDTDFLMDVMELITQQDLIQLSEEQIALLFANRRLPKRSTGLGNMIKKFIERGATYTTNVFLSGATYPYWEVKYDCVRTVINIDDKDSLHVLSSFSTMSYWKARRRIIDYINDRISENKLTPQDKGTAKQILLQVTTDGVRLKLKILRDLKKQDI